MQMIVDLPDYAHRAAKHVDVGSDQWCVSSHIRLSEPFTIPTIHRSGYTCCGDAECAS